MGLFDQILGAIANPSQKGNVNDLSNILKTFQQLAGRHGVDASTLQSIVSSLGEHVRSALQSQGASDETEKAEST